MALIRADLIKESTLSNGTGNIVTIGAAIGSRPFSAVCSIGDTFYYSLRGFDLLGNPTGEFETGIGTYVAVNTIARTTVQTSSNGGGHISLASPVAQIAISLTAGDIAGVAAQVPGLAASMAAPGGSAQIGFIPSGTGATPITVQDVLQGIRTNLDFVPKSERAAILSGTSTYDATTAVQKAIDAAGSQYRLLWLGIVNTGALSSAASVDWEFAAGAKVKQIPAVYGGPHVTLSGSRVRISGAEFDGNQDAMTASQGGNGLLISGASPTLLNVKCHDYNGIGYTCTSSNTGMRRGLHIGCSFDDNAGLGLNTIAASYLDFANCTFDRNGYGFQKTRANYADTSHGFVAFGVALRMRTHHVTLTACHARDNGRDGFNVNQGSYAVKFAQCLAHGNDDGGFTAAADNTGSGLPGEGEACYDIEYVDCEAYNNYTSGLAIYQAANNITVSGGRYYNNHRLAGNQSVASSYYNGIFVAGGSTGVNIETKCYDDRQFLSISAVAAGALTVPGWVAGAMLAYPKVAIYAGVDQSFKGYGRITAESAGGVTIAPTTFGGVTLESVGVGDYVTQAVQHCGAFFDNNCSGMASVDGAGHRTGASNASGRNVYSGAFSGGQNILLPKERVADKQLIVNSTFDTDIANWAFNTPNGGSTAYIDTGFGRRSGGALKLIAGTAESTGDSALVTDAVQILAGEFCEAGIWAYASARDDARFALYWDFGGGSVFATGARHPGGGWRYLKLGAFLPANIVGVFCRVAAEPGKTVYFDDASLKVVQTHMDAREFSYPARSLPY